MVLLLFCPKFKGKIYTVNDISIKVSNLCFMCLCLQTLKQYLFLMQQIQTLFYALYSYSFNFKYDPMK